METLESCHSEASNVSVKSEDSLTKRNKMEKEEDEYDTEHETAPSRVLLDFKLANHDELTTPSLKLELKLLHSPNPSESNDGNPQPLKPKTFTCNFCRMKFSTSQALGGHQNAHKQERALVKQRRNMVDMTAASSGAAPLPPYGLPGYSYYPYSSFPIHGSSNRSSLGVRTESMIQKPYSYHQKRLASLLPFACRFAREKMPRPYLISPSPSTPYDGLRVENFQSRGLTIDGFGGSLNLGENPNPAVIDNACNGATTKVNEGGDNGHQRLRMGVVDDGDDQYDGFGLDLELKL